MALEQPVDPCCSMESTEGRDGDVVFYCLFSPLIQQDSVLETSCFALVSFLAAE